VAHPEVTSTYVSGPTCQHWIGSRSAAAATFNRSPLPGSACTRTIRGDQPAICSRPTDTHSRSGRRTTGSPRSRYNLEPDSTPTVAAGATRSINSSNTGVCDGATSASCDHDPHLASAPCDHTQPAVGLNSPKYRTRRPVARPVATHHRIPRSANPSSNHVDDGCTAPPVSNVSSRSTTTRRRASLTRDILVVHPHPPRRRVDHQARVLHHRRNRPPPRLRRPPHHRT